MAWNAGEAATLSPNEIYNVHSLVTNQLRLEINAWKTSISANSMFPFAGQIYKNDIFSSGTKILASRLFIIGIKGKIAFRFNRNFPAFNGLSIRSVIIAGISEILPLIGIVDTRMVDGINQNANL